jgi:monofunctional biosynthetic peptidoglycan transglycosylase
MAVAAMTGEDANFWEHDGIDYEAILKALGYRRGDFDWDDARDRAALRKALGRAWVKRDALRGASTITQQLAKNLYLSPSRNPLRKVKEAVTAWRLERTLGKRRILELYLNVAEMGPNIWGVQAASETYFRKPAVRLNRGGRARRAAALSPAVESGAQAGADALATKPYPPSHGWRIAGNSQDRRGDPEGGGLGYGAGRERHQPLIG